MIDLPNGKIKELESRLSAIGERCGCPFKRRVSLAGYTSFDVGGAAPVMYVPEDLETAREVYRLSREAHLPLKILGGGTNLLVHEGPLAFGVLNTRRLPGDIQVDGVEIRSSCGASMTGVAREAMRQGLTGLEFFGTLPGTVGGAVAVNAGWPEERIQDRISSVLYADPATGGRKAGDFILARLFDRCVKKSSLWRRKAPVAFSEIRRRRLPDGLLRRRV